MNFVTYAIPFFLLFIVLEVTWGCLKGNNTYRVNDSINSVSLGLLSTSSKLIFLNIGLIVFSQIEQNFSLWVLDIESGAHWVMGLLLYDFLYYWFHRISHERQLFWGSHVVHHQSEDYNLSTALRQTSTSFLTTWVFFVPCFVLGMPIYMYVSIASAHLVYQFWVHTQHISKLGLLEWILITPSNHRVHHAQNADYIDKNYGGLLIIWDRLFGTFKEEDLQQPLIYGIRTPLKSWNPLWANMHIFVTMATDAWRTNSWANRLKILTARTGWRPDDVIKQYPQAKLDLTTINKYDPQLSLVCNLSILLQYGLLSVAHFWLGLQIETLDYWVILGSVTAQLSTVLVIGSILDESRSALIWEAGRLLVLSGILVLCYGSALIDASWLYWGAFYLMLSGALMGFSIKTQVGDNRVMTAPSA